MKKDKPTPKNFIARKSKRVHLRIKLKVNGRDQWGNQFEDLVQTTDVGNNGGSFSIKREIKVGSTLKLTGPKGFVALVRVAWVAQDTKKNRQVIGFQLLESRRDWVLQYRNSTDRTSSLVPSKNSR